LPIINVQMLRGRTPEQKSALIEALANTVMETLAVPEEAIRIILTDVAPEDWGNGSRTMAQIRAGSETGR
jgi:4-oxalocrotonate tautomerase